MSLHTLHEKMQSKDIFYVKSKAWNYLNDEKTPVDPRPLNDILWGLKAFCASAC